MGGSSSKPVDPPPEEDKDIDFNESTTDTVVPPDPHATDEDIEENVRGTEVMSVANVTSDYSEIKDAILKKSEESGKRYVYKDVEFPAESKSLTPGRTPSKWNSIEWKRPSDISPNPRLISEGISSEDIIQGELGNCWWLASCAAISRSPNFLRKVVPSDQQISGKDYVGMFHFRFWRFGEWIDVVVDDSIPCKYGRPCFGRSADPNEFWLSLLEKAYAKIHESYKAIEGGVTTDGMEDLTGGIAVAYDLGSKTPNDLFWTLLRATRNDSFVCGEISGSEGNIVDKRTGLISAHAYSLLRVVEVPYEGGKVKLLKLRNPWGGDTEWKGDWSDGSYKWDTMDESVKEKLGYTDKENGQWWMSYEDFIYYFHTVTVCSIGPDFDSDGAPTGDKWLLSSINGDWILGVSAGGCRNDLYSYVKNTQYYMELKESDDFNPEEDNPDTRGMCSVVVGLMQEYTRVGNPEGTKHEYIGLNIFKLSSRPERKLDERYFSRNREVETTGNYVNKREVVITAELHPGHYVIVPSTFHPEKKGSFLIRIYTEKNINIEEIN